MGKTRGPVRLSEDERKTLNLTDPCKRLPEREREREGEREREREREKEREKAHYDHAWLSLLYLNKVPQAHLVSG